MSTTAPLIHLDGLSKVFYTDDLSYAWLAGAGGVLFIVAAGQSGHHEDGRTTYGHSLIVDPWGDVLLDMGDGAGVKVADIDLSRITDVRSRVPAISHRRPIEAAVER